MMTHSPVPARQPGPFEVRSARHADVAGIVAINCEGVPGVSALGPPAVEEFLRLSHCFRVAEQVRRLVAYLIGLGSDAAYDGEEFLWFRERFQEFIYVDQVAVLKAARGKGAASALYDDLEGFAAARAVHLVTLEVNLRPENPPSLAFHERRGFTEAGRLETRDRRLVSLMTKRLEGPA